MTQHSLITRLKAVEGVLGDLIELANIAMRQASDDGAEYDRAEELRDAHAALSDLRELIKEAEGQEPKAWADAWGVPFDNRKDAMVDDESTPAPLYTALGEKPAAAKQQQAKEKKE